MKINIIDYGLGNLWSVKNAFEYLGHDVSISSDPTEISTSDCLVLPGVGNFGAGIRNIKARNLIDALDEAVINRKRPLLGICLGMQLLGRYSDEASNVQGLNWIPGNVKKINRIQVRLPHMGFNEVKPSAQGSELFKGMEDGSDFYFVHSYYFQADNDENIISTSSYGSVFASGIQHGNIVGVQFHPEKSQSNGLQFLKNFIEFSSAF